MRRASWWVVAALALLIGAHAAGCVTSRRAERRPGAVLVRKSAVHTFEASPSAPRRPRRPPAAARCARVCAHILAVTTRAGGPMAPRRRAGWLARCRVACDDNASNGQLDCYERVKQPSELDACTVGN